MEDKVAPLEGGPEQVENILQEFNKDAFWFSLGIREDRLILRELKSYYYLIYAYTYY